MGGSQPSTVTQKSTYEMSPEQRQIFEMAMPSIEAYASSTPSLFAGSGIAPLTPLEQQARASLLNTSAPAAEQLAGNAANAQNLMMDPDFMLNPNQYVQAAGAGATEHVTRNLMENILPGVRSGAASAGGGYSGGSTREGIATGKAIGATNFGLSKALADMYHANYQSGMSNMAGAVGRNQGVIDSQLAAPSIVSGVGAQDRAIQQATLDEDIRRFYASQDLDLAKAQSVLGLVQGMPGGTNVSQATGMAPKANPLMQILGLGTAVSGMFGNPMAGMMGGAAKVGAGK